MNWKHWPYWVKGLCIGFVIFVVLISLAYFLNDARIAPDWSNYITLFFSGIPLMTARFLIVPLFCTDTGWFACIVPALITTAILTLIEFLLVGALLGHLYGKRKAKKAGAISLS